MVLVHGGPGSFDHSYLTPDFGRRAEIAQVVYLDHPVVHRHSMGGPIVLLYATRHPGHAAWILVQSGVARWDAARLAAAFTALAGDEVG